MEFSELIEDTLLNLDQTSADCFYRLLRNKDGRKKIIYVWLTSNEILPQCSQNSNDELIRDLSQLEGWYGEWDTLKVSRNQDGLRFDFDEFEGHALLSSKIANGYEHFNLLDLQVLACKKSRVSYVKAGSKECYLKIARFAFEIGWVQQEIDIYHKLAQCDSKLAPKFLGYAYDGVETRVIGFLVESVDGSRAGFADFQVCKEALHRLHSMDILHGDIVRDNILITSTGPKFIDFEDSCIGPTGELEEWNWKKAQEVGLLKDALLDTSDRGRPWNDAG